MTGDPADQALSALDALGVDVDRSKALRAMVNGAERDCKVDDPAYVQRPGGEEFNDLGYVGYEREAEFGRDNLALRLARRPLGPGGDDTRVCERPTSRSREWRRAAAGAPSTTG